MGNYWAFAGCSPGADQEIDRDPRVGRVWSREVPKPEQTPVVYFALAVGSNLIKIGTVVDAARVPVRMNLLQPGCPYELKVLLMLPGFGRREEVKIHRLYAAQAFRGEWFRCEGDLKAMLQIAHVEGG